MLQGLGAYSLVRPLQLRAGIAFLVAVILAHEILGRRINYEVRRRYAGEISPWPLKAELDL